jgi:hypothetical protein
MSTSADDRITLVPIYVNKGAASIGHPCIHTLATRGFLIRCYRASSKIKANKPTQTHIPAEVKTYNSQKNQLSRIPRQVQSKVETDRVHRARFAWSIGHSDCIILVRLFELEKFIERLMDFFKDVSRSGLRLHSQTLFNSVIAYFISLPNNTRLDTLLS